MSLWKKRNEFGRGPCDKLDAVLGGMTCQNYVVEISQWPVISFQAAGCQLKR